MPDIIPEENKDKGKNDLLSRLVSVLKDMLKNPRRILALLLAVVIVWFSLSWGLNKLREQKEIISNKIKETQELSVDAAGLRKKVVSLEDELVKIQGEQESLLTQEKDVFNIRRDEIEGELRDLRIKLAAINEKKSLIEDELEVLKLEKVERETLTPTQRKAQEKEREREEARLKKERSRQEVLQRKHELRLTGAAAEGEIAKLNKALQESKKANSMQAKELREASEKVRELDRIQKDLEGVKEKARSQAEQIKDLNAEKAKQEREISGLKKLNDALEAKSEELYLLAEETKDLRKQTKQLARALDNFIEERRLLNVKIDELKAEIISLEEKNAGMYRELGGAYMQGRLFDLAIDAYNTAVEKDPNHPDAHYRLGLLYKHSQDDEKKAIFHFKRYLSLSPDITAKKRKEVEYLIEMLQHNEIK